MTEGRAVLLASKRMLVFFNVQLAPVFIARADNGDKILRMEEQASVEWIKQRKEEIWKLVQLRMTEMVEVQWKGGQEGIR